jgi:hypothetical protein
VGDDPAADALSHPALLALVVVAAVRRTTVWGIVMVLIGFVVGFAVAIGVVLLAWPR